MLWRPSINQHAVVRSGFQGPARVIVCDETLREGEETPGVYLSQEGRLEIARKLEEANVPEIEVGYVGAIPEHAEFSRMLKREGIRCKLVSHTRTYTRGDEWKAELEQAVEAGSDVLCLLSHGSETLAATMPWLPLEAIPDRVAEAVVYTSELGVMPALALVDGIRTPLDNFIAIYRAAAQAGVKRVYVMDGQGVALPETVYFLTRVLREEVGPETQIAVHCHDDYGLATANTLAGVRAGAEVVDTVVLGLGDKAGIGATEEVVMALEVLYGIATGIRLEALYDVAETVARVFQVQPAPNKAVVGENIARHQIDSHLNTLIRGYWWAWESMKPEFFGRERSLEWAQGKLRTGRSGSVAAKLEALEVELTDRQWDLLLERLRKEVADRQMLMENEVEELIREIRRNV
jgi:isopropylmalate/homocitrate/citramalate synthase